MKKGKTQRKTKKRKTRSFPVVCNLELDHTTSAFISGGEEQSTRDGEMSQKRKNK